MKKQQRVKYLGDSEFPRGAEMIVVTVKVDWGQETIQEILPELRKHVEITLQEPGCDDFLFAVDVNNPDIHSCGD